MVNKNLTNAKKARNDESYTQFADSENGRMNPTLFYIGRNRSCTPNFQYLPAFGGANF